MSACKESLPWERRPQEGEEAYAAFLAYRDSQPWRRSHEATCKGLGKRPSYLKSIERWSSRSDWRGRATAWDDHLQAERDKVAQEEAAKWERRRLQALEEGWETCRKLRARLDQMLAMPPERPAVAPPEPVQESPEPIPDAVEASQAAGKSSTRNPVRGDDLTVIRLAKLVVELEWAILNEALPPPGEINPWTATDEEIKAYMVLHPGVCHPLPRRTG